MPQPSETSLLNALCDNASGAMFILDERLQCIYMNPAARELTGYSLEEVRDRPLHDLIHHTRPDGSPYPVEECPIDRALPEDNRGRGREFFIHKDGHFYPVEYTASPVRQHGNIVGTVLEARDISSELEAVNALEEETRTLETINRTGSLLAAKLDLDEIVQAVTDAATELSGAQFGAFLYNMARDGVALQLHTLSGAPREALSSFPQPRHTEIFGSTLADVSVVRIDDVSRDPRYGKSAPFHGMPAGLLPVTSYLAAPVYSRSGGILGALVFGHEEPGVFTARSERVVTAIAAQAAIAIDNSALYEAGRREIAERQKYQEHQDLLIQELNHRVKNMLATVQSIATQTLRGHAEEAAMSSFQARLLALSQSHSLIMRESWRDVDLAEVAATALDPYVGSTTGGDGPLLEGPRIRLTPKAALALGMGFHELATNAAKYGALKSEESRLEIRWREVDESTLCITWVEKGGPPAEPPRRKGFGSRLLERGLAHELHGTVKILHDPGGLICEMYLPVQEITP